MLLLIALFIVIFSWGMRKTISDMRKSPDFTDRDVMAVRRQMLTLLVGGSLVVLFVTISPLIWERPSPSTIYIGMILGFAPLAYLAVSWIRDRIAIGGGSLPIKGARAVRSGVISLVFLIMMFTGFAIYFASYFASWK
jgi:hypothetical protein